MWLYIATGNTTYELAAESVWTAHLQSASPSSFDWDDKTAGVALLLANYTKNVMAKASLQSFLTAWLPGGTVPYTPSGLAFGVTWGTLAAALNTAFLAAAAADTTALPTSTQRTAYVNFAVAQLTYVLGSSGRSFVVGYGVNPPTHAHSPGASCAAPPATCGWPQLDATTPNPHVITGGVVGGPNIHDQVSAGPECAADESSNHRAPHTHTPLPRVPSSRPGNPHPASNTALRTDTCLRREFVGRVTCLMCLTCRCSSVTVRRPSHRLRRDGGRSGLQRRNHWPRISSVLHSVPSVAQ